MEELENVQETQLVQKDETRMDDQPENQFRRFAIRQILARAAAEIEVCEQKLKTESNSRRIAYLQGIIPGCKKLIEYISDVFGKIVLSQSLVDISELSLKELSMIYQDVLWLEKSKSFFALEQKINARIREIESYLLRNAQKARELDVYQGEYRGISIYRKIIYGMKSVYIKAKESEPLFNDKDETPLRNAYEQEEIEEQAI